ncbi:NmrA family NAD(P)-binding protein [Nocardia asiatica]|uniref:NmrA family NAD(P)-binding protein n=1 Tax=Nocardia asiatica TaxID=209252 RepID=UPI003EDFFF89
MSPQHNLILVTGATGKQGGVTARRLLADGTAVRALVRDAQAPAAQELAAAGAELVVGDFDSPQSLPAALSGVTGLFLVPPAAYGAQGWDVDLEAARGLAVVDAAREAGVRQIVFTGIASWATTPRGARRARSASKTPSSPAAPATPCCARCASWRTTCCARHRSTASSTAYIGISSRPKGR